MLRRWNALRLQPLGGAARSSNHALDRVRVILLAIAFVVIATLILSLDSILALSGQNANLRIDSIVEQDIRAPRSITYVSQALTERAREAAVRAVEPIYDPPDPNVARQQLELTRTMLGYIASVRLDPYGTRAQKVGDLQAIAAVKLPEEVARQVIEVDDETWRLIEVEITNVLERVMREPIRTPDLDAVRAQLPMQVSVRLGPRDAEIVTTVLEDLIRPNQFENPTSTEAAREAARETTPQETRSFAQGQVVVRAGTRIDSVDYEALQALGLLQVADGGWTVLARSVLASIVVLVGVGLYIVRFQASLRQQFSLVVLLTGLFLLALLGAQVFAVSDQYYLYPAAALALLVVSLAPVEMAIVSGLALALLYGLIAGGSLEAAALAGFGSLIGAVTLRRTERVNTYFIAGLFISMVNLIIVIVFNLDAIADGENGQWSALVVYSLVNGVFAAAAALAGMYLVTLLFNLPTSLKLVDLSQPSQPLLRRLMREAPGTYQHSLQVANLSEQAANAIGANAQLVRVAALYHDIGKMLNPAFFVENQAEGVNPHDQLNDPMRSADIIISHVIDGDRLAKQYQLPARIRDFILEHHGTTLVGYFYRQAMERADDPDAVDTKPFRYPGPRPRSRETAILMLADTCESTVRARKPANRQEIAEIVTEMADTRLREGQLDDTDLTARDLKTIRAVFIEMLQAVFHPRINYPALPSSRRGSGDAGREPKAGESAGKAGDGPRGGGTAPAPTAKPLTPENGAEVTASRSDDEPLPDVPPLRRVPKPADGQRSHETAAPEKSAAEGSDDDV